jgi:GNAT superfamily N-acetyltransferase
VILTARRFAPGLERDFFALHALGTAPDDTPGGWCFCTAWHVPTWDGWGERTAAENRALRQALGDAGEHDGYLGYVPGVPAPVAWCQVGARDRLPKLCAQLDLAPDPGVFAITCFFVAPAWREQGVAAALLAVVLADLRARGVARVEAYPRRGAGLSAGDAWNGPEAMYRAAGFTTVRDRTPRAVMRRDLG